MVRSSGLTKLGFSAARIVAGLGVALFVGGFTTPTGTRQPSPAAVPPGALRIVAFGSSSTQGVGASGPAATYPAQLETILARTLPTGSGVEVLNKGVGGQDVDDMMVRLTSDVIAQRPDIVIWQTGSNDPMRNVPIERFERATRAGVKTMQNAGSEVILMEPQWCPRLDMTANATQFRDVVRKIGEEMKVTVIRRSDLMHRWVAEGRMTKAQMLAPDGLHMSDLGYAELAREIVPEVLKAHAVQAAIKNAGHAGPSPAAAVQSQAAIIR